MRQPAERSNLRKKAELAYREYRALLILASRLTAEERKQVDKSLENLPRLSRSQLQVEYTKLREELIDLRRTLGAKASLAEYEKLLKHISDTSVEKVLFIPKFVLQKLYFDHYERIFPLFTSLPPHTRIAIDILGILRRTKPEIGWTLLEAKLFEDMALLWDATLDASVEGKPHGGSVRAWKWVEALTRATVRSAFHLLEGYLNGMAFDIWITAKPNELSDDVKIKLTEWDSALNRFRPLSLRDKLLQYPKLAIRATHPPLQESNCPEMKELLAQEESVRHALVHPTPKIEEWRDPDTYLREHVFSELTVEDVGKVVDSTIALIRKVNTAIGAKFGNVDIWLFSRNPDEKFPKEAYV